MMKITQLITNLKLWQSSFVALIFLFSFSINAQSVGDDLMANTNGALDTAQAAGSGQGCISGAQADGVTACGWTTAQGVNYAPGNNANGQAHSGDRMWKTFAGNAGEGEFVAQEFSQLPLGTYTVTFYHKWSNGGGITAGYANGSAPKLSFKKSNGDGGWITVDDDVLDIPLGNIGVNSEWTEMTATFEVTEVNDYRLQIYKNGGSQASPNDMYGSLHLDTFSFVYTAEAASPELSLQGIGDLDIPSNAGKFIHLVATADIADLTVYGLGAANNGGGTDGEEWNFPEGSSVSAGDNILLYRDLATVDAYMDASNTFALLLEAPGGSTSPVSGNGNDAIELFFNGSVVETYGDIEFEGGSGNYDHTWAYNDSWAYKVDGEWTYGGPNCSDDEWDNGPISTCDSSCPYPFVVCEVVSDGCDLTINMEDTFGDGWNGNYLDVYVNGELSQGGLTIADGATATATVSASYGDTVLFDMVAAGTYIGETQFNVTDADGNTVASAADGDDATFECIDPNAVNLAVSATTDGGSATFTFDIANFTVGAAAGEGDGHIHYSLNGGAEVMVYSADPLTLSDLPNGDHTIVFSLVDPAHQPFDPAVEATVDFSTFSGIVDCGETASICYGNTSSTELWFSSTAPEGQVASVTFAGGVENGYDYVVVTNGAGVTLTDTLTGDLTDVTVTSDDNGLMVYIDSDSSWTCQTGQSGFASLDATVSCAVPQTAVTFNVDMSQYELADGDTVHVNGEFTGWCGDCGYNVMSDDDGDGIYSLTLQLDPGSYFWKYTVNGWTDQESFSEAVDGCTVNNNGNFDRQVVVGAEALEVSYCFNTCEAAGECPVPPTTYDVAFSVDTNNYNNGEGIADTDQLYVSGSFNNWSGMGNPMSDDDGDGIWEATIAIADGDYEYKFTMNNWAVQEEFSEVVEGCTVSDGTFTNRALTVAGEDMVLPTVYWNLCPGVTPGEVYNVTFNLDATAIEVGENGMHMGGGFLGGANAVPMSDEDGDGIWTVTLELSTDRIGQAYTYVNSPNDGNDYDGKKEDISGQECAVGQWNDRAVLEFSGDTEFCFVYAVCTDGVCADDPVTFPICEDFEGEDATAGWTFIDAGGATSDWLIDTPANTGDQSIGHGYLPQDVTYNDWAVSPSYNTSGLAEGTATVSYYEYLNWSGDAQAHNVYYTLDYAGDATTATWVLLTDVIGTDAEDVFVQRTFNIPSAESVVIGFQYLNTYGADWNIDDMCIDGTLSTTDTELLDMRIYPNPVNGNYVTIQSPIQGLKEVEVYTVTGRKVLQTVLTDDKLDVSSFNSGFYMVKVTINGQSKLSKLVVR